MNSIGEVEDVLPRKAAEPERSPQKGSHFTCNMTFVAVSYGDNRRKLFNPNCRTRLFIESVKRRCGCPDEMEVDLSDEFGNLKNIAQSTETYAHHLLSVDRENLVLIQVKRSDVTSPTNDDVAYIPMLKNDDIITSRFTARLGSRDSPTPRPESRTKKTSKDKRDRSNRRNVDTLSGDKNDVTMPSVSIASSKRNGSSKKRNSSTPTRSKSRGKPR